MQNQEQQHHNKSEPSLSGPGSTGNFARLESSGRKCSQTCKRCGTMFDSALFGIGASVLILNFATTKKQPNYYGFQRHVACLMCSILKALVVLFNIVKHRL